MSSISVYFNKMVNICARVGAMSNASQQINLVQNDTGPKLRFTIKDCEGDIIGSGVSAVLFHLAPFCGSKTNCGHEATSGVDVANGIYDYCLSGGDISGVGTYYGEVEIIYDSGKVETAFEPVRIAVRATNKAC